MKAQKKINTHLILELEGETQRDLFEQFAQNEEVFGEKVCGKCGSECFRCNLIISDLPL